MEVIFRNAYLEKLFIGLPVSGKLRYQSDVIEKFRKKVLILQSVDSIADLRLFKGLHFESLKGDKAGLYSIRVDLKYRLEFSLENDKITLQELLIIENLSNHYR